MNISQHINFTYQTNNRPELEKLKESLLNTKQEYDIFFEEYLEVFDDKMSASSTQNTPEWKAYKDKYQAYTKVTENIKLIDYYLGSM
jgi:hypothetical protein